MFGKKGPTNRINGERDQRERESAEFTLGAKSAVGEVNARWKSTGKFPFGSFAFAMITITALTWLVYYFTTQAIQVRDFKRQIEALENRK